MAFRCGYCPALSVRDGPAHSRSCPRYKPPAIRKRKPAGHKVVPIEQEELQETTIRLKDGKEVHPICGWVCKRCGYKWYDRSNPWPRTEPVCHEVILQKVHES